MLVMDARLNVLQGCKANWPSLRMNTLATRLLSTAWRKAVRYVVALAATIDKQG